MTTTPEEHKQSLNEAVKRAVITKTCEQVYSDINCILDSLEPETRKVMCVWMNSITWK